MYSLSMENEKTYTGSCHCGTVTFTATSAPITQAMSCNCSHCSRKGFLLHFIPRVSFTLTSGEDNLTEYRFNKKKIAHLFCKTCGIEGFGFGEGEDGSKMVALNVRCLEDIDLDTLEIQQFNGKEY